VKFEMRRIAQNVCEVATAILNAELPS
jgi:hypothetical protein